jgi:surface protein
MTGMFYDAWAFNGDTSSFDTSKVTDMSGMFRSASAFNGDISSFDTSKVTDMTGMLNRASAFNGDISSFDTSKVADMRSMFWCASDFNGDISSWDTSSVTSTDNMLINVCLMDPKKLPAGLTLENTNLLSCTYCLNCPPEGGECTNGFKRSDSLTCDVCPEYTTKINDSCMSCPSNPILSSFLSFLVLLLLTLFTGLVYALRNSRLVRYLKPSPNLTNMIRAKQVGAALQVLVVFAALSNNLSTWFNFLADAFSKISMPVEVQPICTSWYEEISRSDYYFISAWLAFFVILFISFLLRYAHKITIKGERMFEISTLVNCQVRLLSMFKSIAPKI